MKTNFLRRDTILSVKSDMYECKFEVYVEYDTEI